MRSVVATRHGIEIRIKVIPKSSRSEIVGELDGLLKVKLNSPPVDGAANKELIKLLSKALGIAKSRMTITKGEKSRVKTIEATTRSAQRLIDRLTFISGENSDS